MAIKIAWAMIIGALVLAILHGFRHGTFLGGALALAAVAPAGFGAWKGMQQESQAPMVVAVLTIFFALGLAAVLFLLRIFGWLH